MVTLAARVGAPGRTAWPEADAPAAAAYSDVRAPAGAATFFLPCGFTQAVQLYALSTGSPVSAGLTMAVFAVGTSPGLLALASLPNLGRGGAVPGQAL